MGTLRRPDGDIDRTVVLSQVVSCLQDHAHEMPVDTAGHLYDTVIAPLLDQEYRRGAIGWQRLAAASLDEHEAREHERHGLRYALARNRYHATMDSDWLRSNADKMEQNDLAGE